MVTNMVSLQTREKISQTLKRKGIKPPVHKGSEHYNWKGGVSVNRISTNSYQREYLRKLRVIVVDTLSGKCITCGFLDKRALQIDHINGGGSQERKSRIGFSRNFHKHVIDSFLKGEDKYQLLCANCNWIKRSEKNEAKGRMEKDY